MRQQAPCHGVDPLIRNDFLAIAIAPSVQPV
jgi:hypothetical protein